MTKSNWRKIQETYDPSINGEICLFCGKEVTESQAAFKTWIHVCKEHGGLLKYVGFAAELEATEHHNLLAKEYQRGVKEGNSGRIMYEKGRESAIEEMLDRLKGCVNSTYDSYKNIEAFLTCDEIVECQTCRTLKISSPTPEGDDTCPSCGDVEMLDYEFTPHRPTYSESKLKK